MIREGPGQKVEEGKGGNRRDKWWRSADGCKVQVNGRSAPGRVGGRSRDKSEVDQHQTVTEGGGGRRYRTCQ